ncbi:MAG: 2-C-methyl-D-erythritol 4-phosphate cytidylyltransferase [Polaromonas sp.]|uniref:2-C-methyl-D-erythritol 4-phosphate cytidylyltransferase n=1 Tax=Polaromonas sp. TaxID=1869339 RepID=UPI0025F6E455|nr:2-C-methyl-D-erythritol 4-phosphate cytidylyltransferase [Polaromonas sp.]MBI2728301.1 2-C-methyl-D-erythritol 4-phosphate cytidylyltransferase [Polaromonas sp.]
MNTPAQKIRLYALIPCAGNGSRAGTHPDHMGPKQYRPILGKSMVAHTVEAFRGLGDLLSGLCVVISPDDDAFPKACPDFNRPLDMLLSAGGPTRAATVLNGLQAMMGQGGAQPTDWVLVHDAARCLVTPAQILALVDACMGDEVGGLLAQALPDTLKSGAFGRVTATIDRSGKFLAQTPQMFRIGALVKALQAAGDNVTDESSAMELAGLSPKLVAGSAQNFKVTYPEDFALAEAILAGRQALKN